MGYFDKFNRKGIPFMEDREKGDFSEILGKPLHIIDHGFIDGDNGEFPVLLFAESDKFYFGNSICGEMLREVEKDEMVDKLESQAIVFTSRRSKNGRDYTAFEFTDDDIPF